MPVGQLITIGVGSPGTIGLLTTTGLGSLTPPVNPPSPPGGLIPGLTASLSANVIYALPARLVNIEWLAAGAGRLDVSLDKANWTTLDTAVGAENRLVSAVCAVFIRSTIDVTVTCRKTKNRL